MTAQMERMNLALEQTPDMRNSKESKKLAVRLMIRAANLDRRLIEDRDWQAVMIHLNNLNGRNL
jgi:hypothetical protein